MATRDYSFVRLKTGKNNLDLSDTKIEDGEHA